MKFIFLSLFVVLFATTSQAENQSGYFLSTHIQTSLSRPAMDYPISNYQIGPEWGKKDVTQKMLDSETPVFNRTAKSTAYFGSATAFYLGKFNGQYVMATNYHVLSSEWQCSFNQARFDIYGKSFPCAQFLGSWSDVDFALFTIDVTNPDDEAFLNSVALNMGFHTPIYKGQELLTIGHGIAGNSAMNLVAGQDNDCKVFSEASDVRFMADPDDVNPGDYKVWSFANGCDVSHGDSGSAMVDRKTGDIVGIIWTGRIPKNPKVRSEEYLQQIYKDNSNDIWKELSYAAPATKIYEVLSQYLSNSNLPPEKADTIRDILN